MVRTNDKVKSSSRTPGGVGGPGVRVGRTEPQGNDSSRWSEPYTHGVTGDFVPQRCVLGVRSDSEVCRNEVCSDGRVVPRGLEEDGAGGSVFSETQVPTRVASGS